MISEGDFPWKFYLPSRNSEWGDDILSTYESADTSLSSTTVLIPDNWEWYKEYKITWTPRDPTWFRLAASQVEIPGLLDEAQEAAVIPFEGSWHYSVLYYSYDTSVLNGYIVGGSYPSVAYSAYRAFDHNTDKFMMNRLVGVPGE